MIFFTSDHHFDHTNIIKYCDRPFKNAGHMNNILIQKWNEVVKPEDTVFYIGDFCMTNNSEKASSWIKRLNGTKHLILGNHDKINIWKYIDIGFSSVHKSFKLPLGNKEIYLVHDPAVKTALPNGSILIHGHVHNLWKTMPDKGLINVGVDVWEFKPVSEEQILELLKDQFTSLED